jgi:chromosome segregation ATPase
MSQQDAFQSALDRQSAATASAVAGITREIQQLKDAVDALSTSKAPTQAQLNQLNASASALEQAASALSADDTGGTSTA